MRIIRYLYNVDLRLTPTLGGPAEKLVRVRVVYAHDDLLPYRPVVLHLGVFPFVTDAVRVRVVLDHGGDRGVPACRYLSLGKTDGGCLRRRRRLGGLVQPEYAIGPVVEETASRVRWWRSRVNRARR